MIITWLQISTRMRRRVAIKSISVERLRSVGMTMRCFWNHDMWSAVHTIRDLLDIGTHYWHSIKCHATPHLATTGRLTNVVLMLAQRCRRCATIKTTFVICPAVAGQSHPRLPSNTYLSSRHNKGFKIWILAAFRIMRWIGSVCVHTVDTWQ